MSQLSGDTALVQYTTGQQLGAMLNSLSAMIFGIVIAFIANWKLALVVLAATPLLGAAQAAQLQLITAGEKGVSEELRESVGDFTECVMGIREMHAFRLYEAAAASYERLMRAPLRVAIKSDFATAFAMGMSQFITFGFYALTFWYGGKLIDDGELDWKVIAVATSDPLASKLNDIDDVEKECPGYVSGIREWFRWYKTPDDKPLNAFGFDEAALPKAKTVEVIAETHAAWKGLRDGSIDAGKLWTGK